MLKGLKTLTLLIAVLYGQVLFAQQVLKYKNYSSQNNVSSGVVIQNGFWAGSDGGSFLFSNKDNSYTTFTKTEGLNGSPVTAVALDNQNQIWFGSVNGIIDVYNQSTKTFRRIVEIYNSGRNLKQINSFFVKGDTVVVSTSFGLSLIDSNTLTFYDTYFKFGNFSPDISVNNCFFSNQLFYVATQSGVAIQKPGATNLISPDSWNTYTASDSLPATNINKILSFNDTLITITSNGISYFNQNIWLPFSNQFNNKNVIDAYVQSDSLFVLIGNALYLYFNGTLQNIFTSSFNPVEIIYASSGKILLATNNGVQMWDKSGALNSYFPNGPLYNIFSGISVSPNGNFWVSTGDDKVNKGCYKYDNTKWTNYYLPSYYPTGNNGVYNVYAPDNNNTYLGTWGEGFAKVSANNVFTFYNTGNTGLVGIQLNPNFLVITSLGQDSQGNLWVLNYESAVRKTLSVLTTDSTWYYFDNLADPSPIPTQYMMMMIDQYDTKWFVSTNPNKSGLFFFNENTLNGKKTFSDVQDDRYGYLSTANGLNTNTITALVLDKQGEIWIGTSQGANVIFNNQAALDPNPQFNITSIYSLRQQTINCIAVDAINQKWVGTNQGILVVSPDGTYLVAAYSAENSPLVSDVVTSIAIDEQRGIVYAGCNGGLTAFYTSILTPQESFTKLNIYPSPFIIGNNNSLVTIDGLVQNSEIKILSIAGRLIRELTTPGGRIAFWDGKDLNGNFVGSGIYIIVAYDQTGNNVAKEKIAVIRK
jgi:ligand-binding sensor domain-containing protein